MRRVRATRLLTALLAVLFLAGVAGTSGLDALLFHRSGAPAAAQAPHVEPASAAGHHADQCLLAFRLAGGRLTTALAFPVRVEGLPLRRAAAIPAAAPLPFYPGLHQQSRAPPSSAPIA
ncbi:MAG TPA: hypothetical protein VEQ10_01215 [Vicinamibacteria bacterium]|nr:hypothetical protein [Vicinamibacteria bacterium]